MISQRWAVPSLVPPLHLHPTMRTFTRLALVLSVVATCGHASAREVDADGSIEAPPDARSDKAHAKESTVSAKYDASYPTRDLSRARKPGFI